MSCVGVSDGEPMSRVCVSVGGAYDWRLVVVGSVCVRVGSLDVV